MGRTNIHMAIDMPGQNEVISGMRNSCEVVIDININQAVFKGKLPFYMAVNGVVLCPGAGNRGAIPSEYFRSVFNVKSN